MTHEHLIQHCKAVADTLGVWVGWSGLEGPWRRGEQPDWFGVFKTPADMDGQKALFGDTIVLECKASDADFRKDLLKPWRRLDTCALGNWRVYVSPIDVVDVAYVPDPWGLVWIDDAGAHVVVKHPQRVHKVDAASERVLLACAISERFRRAAEYTRGGESPLGETDFDRCRPFMEEPIAVGALRREAGLKLRADLLRRRLELHPEVVCETRFGKTYVCLKEAG